MRAIAASRPPHLRKPQQLLRSRRPPLWVPTPVKANHDIWWLAGGPILIIITINMVKGCNMKDIVDHH
jgi:hypothetical protein